MFQRQREEGQLKRQLGQARTDATIRHPLAKKYMRGAASRDGFANEKASEDKQRRYPDKAGLHVITASVETFGRLGEEFEALLTQLAATARQRQGQQGIPHTRWLHKWRCALSTILARGTAKALSEALSGNGSWAGEGPRSIN